MPTNEERREVAARLRKAIGLHEFAEVLGFNWADDSDWVWNDVSNLVADLIDPTCEARRDMLLCPATDLTPEYEEPVFRCGRCGEIVSYDKDYDPETDLPAYCEHCGSRVTGIGEPWDE